MHPGDMIEWVYHSTGEPVKKDEKLWSNTMKRWVPIGAPALLISVTDEICAWLTPEGVFHARVDDARWVRGRRDDLLVVSRKSNDDEI